MLTWSRSSSVSTNEAGLRFTSRVRSCVIWDAVSMSSSRIDIDEVHCLGDCNRFLVENLVKEEVHRLCKARKSVLNVELLCVLPLGCMPHGHRVEGQRLINAFKITRTLRQKNFCGRLCAFGNERSPFGRKA
jgi:hypothetical protein